VIHCKNISGDVSSIEFIHKARLALIVQEPSVIMIALLKIRMGELTL